MRKIKFAKFFFVLALIAGDHSATTWAAADNDGSPAGPADRGGKNSADAGGANAPAKADPLAGSSAAYKFDQVKRDPFLYAPINPVFWETVQSNVANDNSIRILMISQKYFDESKSSNDDQSEARLAVGIGLERLGLTFGAARTYADLIRKRQGSLIAVEALRGLNRIAQNFFYDTREFGDDLLASQEFGPLPPELQSFVSFHSGIYNMRQGFREWSDSDLKKVDPQSYWGLKLDYLKALGEIARGKPELGDARLEKLAVPAVGFPALDQRIKLQLARLAFEREKYDDAYLRYRALNSFDPRDQARVLTERAWTRFYQRDYSKALGELAVLETPTYLAIQPFESYVLRMLIYKELCRYDLVRKTANQFRARYKTSIASIRGRKVLAKDFPLAKQALLSYPRQGWADLINQMRTEMALIQELHLTEIPAVAQIYDDYKGREAELKWLVDQSMEQATNEAAELLLDTEEQVSFLDYASTLDALRIIQRSEDRKYESEKISYLKFDSIYWPEDEELWTDEFGDYKVLIESRCNLYDAAAPGKNKTPLPKEFQ